MWWQHCIEISLVVNGGANKRFSHYTHPHTHAQYSLKKIVWKFLQHDQRIPARIVYCNEIWYDAYRIEERLPSGSLISAGDASALRNCPGFQLKQNMSKALRCRTEVRLYRERFSLRVLCMNTHEKNVHTHSRTHGAERLTQSNIHGGGGGGGGVVRHSVNVRAFQPLNAISITLGIFTSAAKRNMSTYSSSKYFTNIFRTAYDRFVWHVIKNYD